MKLSRIITNAVATLALVFGGLTAIAPAQATAVCTAPAGAAATSLVLCSDAGTFTARAPLSDTGVLSQTISMNIDPTKMSLSSAAQIVAPTGWTISYYNGSSWSSTAPANPAAWAAITKVKATGILNSQGTVSGQQVSTSVATAVAPPSGAFTSSGSGDGWDVFFDNANHVYNVYHHDSPAGIDCHTRTGVTCSGSWPFSIAPYHTRMRATGFVDNTNHHLWVPTNTTSTSGFVCVNITNVASPAFCGGSAAAAYVQLGNHGGIAQLYDGTEAFAQSGTRLFTWDRFAGTIECLDMAANAGAGAGCSSQPVTFAGVTSASTSSTLLAYDGKIYGSTDQKAVCIDAVTFTACSGWPISLSAPAYTNFTLPNASGTIVGICYVNMGTNPCYTLAGASLSRPAGFNISTVNNGAYETAGQNPSSSGSRVYWAENYGSPTVRCWDMATAAACANWPVSGAVNRYTVQVDPYNSQCIWTNGDPGVIQAWDSILGTLGCTSLPSDVTFDANVIVPRMGCSQTDAITAWQNFTLTGPASGKYSSATLTVTQQDGTAIAGWSNVAIAGSRIVDLSSLTVAQSGQLPQFRVHFNNRTGTTPADDATASVTAVGAEPELCITPDIHYACPTVLGPLNSLAAQSVALSADGSVTLPNTTVENLTSASSTYSVATPSLSACQATLTGQAAGAGGGRGVPGVTVTLLDSTGAPVLNPATSNPYTALTDNSGNYSFTGLAFGDYKVSFPNKSSNMTVSASTVTTGGSGSTSASAGVAVSNTSTLTSSVNGVVNAAYILPPIAPSRTQIAAVNTNVVFNAFAAGGASLTVGDPLAATSSTASNFIGTTGATRLCSSSEVPNSCASTSVATANGTFTVNTSNGVITFVPNTGFVGVGASVTYVVTDAASQKTSAVFTPVLSAPSAAVNDQSWGQRGLVQTIYPLSNDSVTAGNSLTPSTVLLCGPTETAPSCTQTSRTVANEGTYTVNSTNGQVTFTPLVTFFGDATPIGYQVTDLLGAVVAATITPHVIEGHLVTPSPTPTPSGTPSASPSTTPSATPSPSVTPPSSGSSSGSAAAKPDFKTGVAGTPVTVEQLGNDPVANGAPKSVKICEVGSQSTSACADTTVATADGDWKVNASGSVTFVPADGFFGKASIGYRAKDASGKTVWSYITVTIPEKAGLAYTGGGDQQGLALWMLGLLMAGIALVVASRRRQ
ncbi:MAG: Ig-like domain-containing protein [Micrococcales bacterium]